MKTLDGARLIHVQCEDTGHLRCVRYVRYVRRVAARLAAQELPRQTFKKHAEADVANAFGRHPA